MDHYNMLYRYAQPWDFGTKSGYLHAIKDGTEIFTASSKYCTNLNDNIKYAEVSVIV